MAETRTTRIESEQYEALAAAAQLRGTSAQSLARDFIASHLSQEAASTQQAAAASTQQEAAFTQHVAAQTQQAAAASTQQEAVSTQQTAAASTQQEAAASVGEAAGNGSILEPCSWTDGRPVLSLRYENENGKGKWFFGSHPVKIALVPVGKAASHGKLIPNAMQITIRSDPRLGMKGFVYNIDTNFNENFPPICASTREEAMENLRTNSAWAEKWLNARLDYSLLAENKVIWEEFEGRNCGKRYGAVPVQF